MTWFLSFMKTFDPVTTMMVLLEGFFISPVTFYNKHNIYMNCWILFKLLFLFAVSAYMENLLF